jgi:hypothetical protein
MIIFGPKVVSSTLARIYLVDDFAGNFTDLLQIGLLIGLGLQGTELGNNLE